MRAWGFARIGVDSGSEGVLGGDVDFSDGFGFGSGAAGQL